MEGAGVRLAVAFGAGAEELQQRLLLRGGADLAMLKPAHVNPSPQILEQLRRASQADPKS